MRPLILAAALLLAAAASAQTAPANDALYQAWGGKDGIRAVMDDFVPRLFDDPRTARFFKGVDRDNLTVQLTDQLCQQSGGPCVYKGKDMKLIHEDLDIRHGDFNALVEILQQSMDARGIPFAAQNGMLARLAPMHREIITPVSDLPPRR